MIRVSGLTLAGHTVPQYVRAVIDYPGAAPYFSFSCCHTSAAGIYRRLETEAEVNQGFYFALSPIWGIPKQ